MRTLKAKNYFRGKQLSRKETFAFFAFFGQIRESLFREKF